MCSPCKHLITVFILSALPKVSLTWSQQQPGNTYKQTLLQTFSSDVGRRFYWAKQTKLTLFFSSLTFWNTGGRVVRCLVLSSHSKKARGSNLGPGLSVWRLQVLPEHAWVSSRRCGFLPQAKAMLLGWSDQSKLTTGLRVTGLSLC